MSRPPYPGAPRPKHIAIDLSPDGVKGLQTLRRMYGGDSISACVDRMLRKCNFNLVPMSILIDSNTAGWLRRYAKENGYDRVEELISDTLETAMLNAQKKP